MRAHILPILAAALLAAACSVSRTTEKADAPLIGITPSYSDMKSTVGFSYINAVRKAGGIPIILPGVRTKDEADALIASIDGIIFSGGEDVDPIRYGEQIWNETVGINHPRDTSDFLMVQAARDRKIPIMGICRGSQLLNVALGGSLYQDIPSQIGTKHSKPYSPGKGIHAIGLEKGSRISELLAGADSVWVNTHHHQSVKQIAPGCRVTARAADGVVEAWEAPGIFSVQFHPEEMILGGEYKFLPIFTAFVEECL